MKTALLILLMILIEKVTLRAQPAKNKFEASVVKIIFTGEYQPGENFSDTVYYSPNRKLNWDDFQGLPRLPSRSAAISYSSFGYIGHSSQRNDTAWVYIILQVYLVKSASWVSPDGRTKANLAHEQLHFDITQLAALHFKDMLLHDQYLAGDYNSRIQYIYIDGFRYMDSLQEAYDRETLHGINSFEQNKWSTDIQKMLN
jgi:hypothetical protein